MLTSIKSDIFLLRDQFKLYLFFFAFMIAMAYIQDSGTVVFFYAMFISVFTTFTLAALSEQSGWEAVLLSAPVSRTHMVRGRYAVCLGFGCVLLLIGFAAAALIHPGMENVYALLIYLPVMLLFIGLLLPIIYKFGTHKARFVLMGLGLLPTFVMFFVTSSDAMPKMPNTQAIERIFTSIPALLTLNAVCLFMLALSCRLSCRIYANKEF